MKETISRRAMLRRVAAAGLSLPVVCSAERLVCGEDAGTQRRRRPNILLLYSDQHNASVLGCEGHPDVLTPNLDRLAAGGVRFTRAYCQDGVCMPSRTSLMTGLYPRTFGALQNGDISSVLDRAKPLAKVLQENGYRTAAFGKRHLGKPGMNIDSGWDIAKSHMYYESPEANYVSWIESQSLAKEFARDWAAEWGRGPKDGSQFNVEYPRADLATRTSALPDGMTMEAYTAREAIAFLKEQKDSDRPFFLWASFYRPHQPYTPLQKYLDLYDREAPGWLSAWGEGRRRKSAIKKPATLDEPIPDLPPLLQEFRKRDKPGGWDFGYAAAHPQIWRDHLGAYYALVTEIDAHVGEILLLLASEGLEDNTIVLYTADHGDFAAEVDIDDVDDEHPLPRLKNKKAGRGKRGQT